MKKAIVIAVGIVLSGCQSAQQVEESSQAAAQIEPALVEVQPAVADGSTKEEAVAIVAVAEQASADVVMVAQSEVQQAPKVVRTSKASPPKAVSKESMAMDPRMDKVVKLIHTSSGARQVMASESPKAHEYHEKAKVLYEQATEATEKSEASRLLNEAVKAMYTAIRSASPEKVLASKKRADFDKLQRSVDTFVEQHQRISEEKGADGDGAALRAQVKALGVEADKVFAAGRTDDAQHLLRESFEMLRDSIEQMREGETLVRSLNFATKKDEYDYELERYKSQRLLVDVLLESKRKSSAYVEKQVSGYMKVAEEGRVKAEAAAGNGDHEGAITFLESARKQIVRALRTGGIYVPG